MNKDQEIAYWKRKVYADINDHNAIKKLSHLLDRIEVEEEEQYEIQRILVASINHVEATDIDYIGDPPEMGVVINYNYGSFIWIPSEEEYLLSMEEYYPDNIFNLMKIAFEENCEWLRLDTMGSVYEHLPIFDW